MSNLIFFWLFRLFTLYKEVNRGNPFSIILLMSGKVESNVLFIVPSSQAYDKQWYYRDPLRNVQGPFNSIDMYHWSLAGYFDLNLEVSCGQTDKFVSLGYFYHLEKQRSQRGTKQVQQFFSNLDNQLQVAS